MRGFYQVSKDSIDRSENPKDGSENPNDQCENPNDLYEETPEVADALPLPKIRKKRQERSRGLCDTPLIGKQLQLAQCPRYLVCVFFPLFIIIIPLLFIPFHTPDVLFLYRTTLVKHS